MGSSLKINSVKLSLFGKSKFSEPHFEFRHGGLKYVVEPSEFSAQCAKEFARLSTVKTDANGQKYRSGSVSLTLEGVSERAYSFEDDEGRLVEGVRGYCTITAVSDPVVCAETNDLIAELQM